MGPHSEQPSDGLNKMILFIREKDVVIDADLARLFGATTGQFDMQVKRNKCRFPDDFMFQLTAEEKAEVAANHEHLSGLKSSPILPYVFTAKGMMMAANVLETPAAIEISVQQLRNYFRLSNEVENYKEKMRTLRQLITEFELRQKTWQSAASL